MAVLQRRDLPLDQVGATDEIGDEAVVGVEIDLFRVADLDDSAFAHHRDLVRKGQRLDPVVGHIDRGDLQLGEKTAQFLARLFPELGVEVAQRFVEENHLGLGHQGPGQGDALLLAAAQLRRRPVFEPLHLHELEGPGHPVRISALATPRF